MQTVFNINLAYRIATNSNLENYLAERRASLPVSESQSFEHSAHSNRVRYLVFYMLIGVSFIYYVPCCLKGEHPRRVENRLLCKVKGTPPFRKSYPLRSALSDNEILKNTTLKNLDTGDTISLAEADGALPRSTSPLDLELIRRTSEISLGHMCKSREKIERASSKASPLTRRASPLPSTSSGKGRRRSSLLRQSG